MGSSEEIAKLAAWSALLLGAGIGGSFAVPGRRLRTMPWDAAWLIYCVVAQIVVPCLLGLAFAGPIFSRVFPEHSSQVAIVMAAGALWGCGTFVYGLSIPRLGIALANAIVNGCVALLGSLTPLLTPGASASLDATELALLLLGLFILAAGIAASCWASILRDRGSGQDAQSAPQTSGVILALVAGCLSSVFNTGYAHALPLSEYAVGHGVPRTASALAVWIPLLAGGFAINVIATNIRLARAGQYALLARSPASDWLRASAMGVLWTSAILVYGLASGLLGKTGVIYGWAVVCGASIFVSTLWGIWLGEWTGTSWRARKWLFVSLCLMMFSFFLIAFGKR